MSVRSPSAFISYLPKTSLRPEAGTKRTKGTLGFSAPGAGPPSFIILARSMPYGTGLLDPVPYGIDLAKMMKEGGPAPGAEKPKVPFVLFVPASGLKEVFGKYEMKAEGDLTLIQFRAGPVYA